MKAGRVGIALGITCYAGAVLAFLTHFGGGPAWGTLLTIFPLAGLVGFLFSLLGIFLDRPKKYAVAGAILNGIFCVYFAPAFFRW